MALDQIIKQPAETLVRAVKHAVAAVAIVGSNVAARGAVAQVIALDAAVSVQGGHVQFNFTGGTDGETYLVTALASFADGETREIELEVAVIDGDWTMPSGGAAMLSVSDFVIRVGIDEILSMTDINRTGRIDKGLVINALVDAQSLAEGHLAARYDLPFISVPPLIEMTISDIARARLYTREPPENIALAAKTAERRLEKIAKGEISLGQQAPANENLSSDPVVIRPGKKAYPDGLEDY